MLVTFQRSLETTSEPIFLSTTPPVDLRLLLPGVQIDEFIYQVDSKSMRFLSSSKNMPDPAENNDEKDGEEQASSHDDDTDEPLSEEDRLLVAALAEQKLHVPGNSWWEDWTLYFCNSHPIFSLCWHHPLHPVSQGMRVAFLLGSTVFGLALTNIIWLFFIYDQDDADAVVIHVSAGSLGWNNETTALLDLGRENSQAKQATAVQINGGMLLLWTAGGLVHALFDSTIWSLASGLCCQAGSYFRPEYQRFGNYLVVLVVLLVAAFCSLIVVVRVTLDEEDGSLDVTKLHSMGVTDDAIDIAQVKDVSNYEFLLSYVVELAMAWFVHFPLSQFVLFSGILVCRKPVWYLGGRVYEVAQEEKRRAEEGENQKEQAISEKEKKSSSKRKKAEV